MDGWMDRRIKDSMSYPRPYNQLVEEIGFEFGAVGLPTKAVNSQALMFLQLTASQSKGKAVFPPLYLLAFACYSI